MAYYYVNLVLVWMFGSEIEVVFCYCGRDYKGSGESSLCVYNLWYFWLGIIALVFLLITGICLLLKKRGHRRRQVESLEHLNRKPATPVKPPPYDAPSQLPPPYTVEPVDPLYPSHPSQNPNMYSNYPDDSVYHPSASDHNAAGSSYPGSSGPPPPSYESSLPGCAN